MPAWGHGEGGRGQRGRVGADWGGEGPGSSGGSRRMCQLSRAGPVEPSANSSSWGRRKIGLSWGLREQREVLMGHVRTARQDWAKGP